MQRRYRNNRSNSPTQPLHDEHLHNRKSRIIRHGLKFHVAGAEGLEPSAYGFGDRCSTN